MRVSQIVKWNQFVRDGKFTAQSSKRQGMLKSNKKKWIIQRNWQHRVHKTQDKQKQKNTTQYVLDTTMRKRTQIT